VKGNQKLTGKAGHGVSSVAKPHAVAGALIKFDKPSAARPGVFQELLKHLGGNAVVLNSDLRLGYLLPQILPGHRLWCYATNRAERFLSVEKSEIRHDPKKKEVWLDLFIAKNDLHRLRISEKKTLLQTDLAGDFELTDGASSGDLVCIQQRKPEPYTADPAEALAKLIQNTKNKIWETVNIASPYRKLYVYCCPSPERNTRLPQLLSVYLVMFFLGWTTRYSPLYFEDLLDSKYGPLFQTFLSESPMQFLYLVASDILGREVSKPAII